MENIKGWVMDETIRLSGDDHNWKDESGARKCSDSEMLKTYSTGLLAVCLAGYALRPFFSPFCYFLLYFILHPMKAHAITKLMIVVVVKWWKMC